MNVIKIKLVLSYDNDNVRTYDLVFVYLDIITIKVSVNNLSFPLIPNEKKTRNLRFEVGTV